MLPKISVTRKLKINLFVTDEPELYAGEIGGIAGGIVGALLIGILGGCCVGKLKYI